MSINESNLQNKIMNYYYQDSKQQDQDIIRLLQQEQYLIKMLQYLYDIFLHNKKIKNKKRLNKLMNRFKELIINEQQLSYLLKKIQNQEEDEDKVLQIINKIIRIPNIILNYGNDTNINYHKIIQNILHNICQFYQSIKIKIDIINKFMILAFYQQVGYAYIKNNKIKNIVRNNINKIVKIDKLVFYILQNNNYQQQLILLFQNIENPIKLLINNVIFRSCTKPSYAIKLYVIIKKLQIMDIQNLVVKILFNWSNVQFPKNTQPYQQKFLSNLLALMIDIVNLQFLHTQEILKNLNTGISMRFQFFKQYQFICQSGIIVWKKYAKKINNQNQEFPKQIQSLCNIQLFQDDLIQKSNIQQKVQISKQIEINSLPKKQIQSQQEINIQQEQEFQQNDFNQFKISRPKNLYDCYLGLLSDKIQRKQFSLKNVDYLVRNNIDDLIFMWQNLANVILKLHDQNNLIQKFQQYKSKALISLIIFRPVDVISLISQYFYKDCSLGDKISIIHIITSAIVELGDNPKKYERIKDQNTNEQNNFYFKKLSSKYKKSQYKINQKQIQRKQKINQKSRRWGFTKKAYEKNLSSQSQLIAIKRQDLIIINEKTNNNAYINRLYLIISQIFFSFILRMRNYNKLLNDNLFGICLIKLLICFADNINNYHQKYKIIDQMLDIHNLITNKKDINLQRVKLNLILKISNIIDKNIIRQQLILQKLFKIVQNYQDKKSQYFDPTFRIITQLIHQNVRKTIDFM